MPPKIDFKNKWVLVTGASSGLGRAISINLAKHEKANLVITARRYELLESLKLEIETSANSIVKIIPTDLGNEQEVERLFREVTDTVDVEILINNAGLTYYGKAETSELQLFDNIFNVNYKAMMILTLRFLERFKSKNKGGILNITSLAGFIPTPYQAIYSASKHAAQAFTEAIIAENRESNVVISSFVPGGIATEMHLKSGMVEKFPVDSIFNLKAETVANIAIKGFKNGKPVIVPGFMNNCAIFLLRCLPRRIITYFLELVFRP